MAGERRVVVGLVHHGHAEVHAEQTRGADRRLGAEGQVAARAEAALVEARPVVLVVEGAGPDPHVGIERGAPAPVHGR